MLFNNFVTDIYSGIQCRLRKSADDTCDVVSMLEGRDAIQERPQVA